MDENEGALDFNLLKEIQIVQDDGTTREINDDEAQDMWASLNQAVSRAEEEGPRMEEVIERLNAQIPDLHIEGIAGFVPIQGDGTYQGEEFYFRSRYSHASLAVGTTDDEPVSSWNPARYAEIRVTEDEFAAGWLSPEEVEVIFPVLIKNLQPRTQEENDQAVQDFSNSVEEIVKEMKKKDT